MRQRLGIQGGRKSGRIRPRRRDMSRKVRKELMVQWIKGMAIGCAMVAMFILGWKMS